MFSKIVICSDGSEGALTATRMGAQIAQKFHSAVLLIHTYELDVAAHSVWELPVRQEGIGSYAEDARLTLEEHTGKILQEAGLKYETLLERGHPVEEITRVAKQHKADLIVIGSRGMSDVQSFLMGSTSEGVLHHAHCPVLIVRGDHTPHQAPELHRILLASDGSEGASQASVVAIRIAQQFTASLSVLNVLDASSLSSRLSPYLPADYATPYTCAEHLLAKITKGVTEEAIKAGVPRSFHQETGYPAEIIVNFADRTDVSLIVIGSRGLGTFTSLLLGSVSNRVAHHSHLSVLVTR